MIRANKLQAYGMRQRATRIRPEALEPFKSLRENIVRNFGPQVMLGWGQSLV